MGGSGNSRDFQSTIEGFFQLERKKGEGIIRVPIGLERLDEEFETCEDEGRTRLVQ
jgi:hypothetical protein